MEFFYGTEEHYFGTPDMLCLRGEDDPQIDMANFLLSDISEGLSKAYVLGLGGLLKLGSNSLLKPGSNSLFQASAWV